MATYKIHPGIGIARLGNSDTEFYLAPETPAGLPQACDAQRQSALSGRTASRRCLSRLSATRRAGSSARRRASRCLSTTKQSPQGRPLKIGDQIEGGGNDGTLIDIRWQVYVANKKACWYQFDTTQGEHGYPADHPAPQCRRHASAAG